MRVFNTRIQEIEFNQLNEKEKEKYLQLLKEQNIKMTYDIDKDEYMALLKIQKTLKKPEEKKEKTKTRALARNKSANILYHDDCMDNSIYNRKTPVKRIKRKSFQKFPENEAFFNKEKMAMITKYQFVFDQVNFFEMNTVPILIPLLKIIKYMEVMYGLLFEQISRKRSYKYIDLGLTLFLYYQNLYPDNYNQRRTFLAKWVYSLDKFKYLREVDFFRQVLIKTVDDDLILYFLYLRENFRFQTQNYFLDHNKDQKDPREIKIETKFGRVILESAFYFNPEFSQNLLRIYDDFVKNSFEISYYDFLFFSMDKVTPAMAEGIDVMTFLIALYDDEDTQKPDIYRRPFDKTPAQTSKVVKD